MTQPSETSDLSPEDWERIARYLTGEADSVETEETRRWVAEDSGRQELVRRTETAIAAVRAARIDDIDVEGALRTVKERARAPKVISISSGAKPAPARRLASYVRAAAAILVVIGALAFWRSMRPSSQLLAIQTFATGIGERRQFTLTDGTRVVLGPASALHVLPSSKDRSVALNGDGYFNVVHDPSHPFVVSAGPVGIRDVGTAFSVRSSEGGLVRIAVDSGAVEIAHSYATPFHGPKLTAHDRATVSSTGITVERAALSEDDLAWVQGRLVFRDTPLAEVGAELYRWYGVRLRVADSSLANLHLTASFSGEPVDSVLRIIALSLGARVERQGNIAILHRVSSVPAGR